MLAEAWAAGFWIGSRGEVVAFFPLSSSSVAVTPLFLHLSRLPGLERERYGDLSIICFLGEKKAGRLSVSGQALTSVRPVGRLRGGRLDIGWAQRKKTWGFAPSLTLKSLCPWISQQTSVSLQLTPLLTCLSTRIPDLTQSFA